MKRTLIFTIACFLSTFVFAVNSGSVKLSTENKAFIESLDIKNINEFIELTPKTFRQKTGKKLGIKNAIKLKMAQKSLKSR